MAAGDFKHAILRDTAHRPWPMPAAPWIMRQTWHDLLFAHWPISASAMRARVPPAFPLDLYDGMAWLGIVPFQMTNVTPRYAPPLPRISEFPELNVRTYVIVDGKPGVYFFSLDAGSALAVRAARWLFNLPYHSAAMNVTSSGGVIQYDSRRRDASPAAIFSTRYGPAGAPFEPRPGSFEYFLTERYCLYNLNRRGEPYRLDIHHPPWQLHPADAEFARNTMGDAAGIPLPGRRPVLHFSRRQDMVAWAPERLADRLK